MVKRNYQMDDNEPEEKKFDLPSEKEHLLQVVDIFTSDDEVGQKLGLDDNTVSVKLEVVGGDEEGRTLLNRCNLEQTEKAFYFTRMFLKAIGEPYKGVFDIETDRWVARQFYATVKHSGKYANIDHYNFDKKIEQVYKEPIKTTDPSDIAWDDN